MRKEQLPNFVLRKNQIVDNDARNPTINYDYDKIILNNENPILSNRSEFQSSLLYNPNLKQLFGNLIYNQIQLSDLTYISSVYTGSAAVTGSESNLINNTGVTVNLPAVGDSATWLFNLPTGNRTQFNSITIRLGSLFNNPNALNNFLILVSNDNIEYKQVCCLGSLPSPMSGSTDVIIDLSDNNFYKNADSLYTAPTHRYIRFLNLGYINTNNFMLKNLNYSSYGADSDWEVLLDLKNSTYFNRYNFQTTPSPPIATTGTIEMYVPNDGTSNVQSGLLPFKGYYEISVRLSIAEYETASPYNPANQDVAAALTLSNPATSATVESFILDKSDVFDVGSGSGLKLKIYSLQGSAIIFIGNSTAGDNSANWLKISYGGSANYKVIDSYSYAEVKYLGTTINN